jgi:hypothetical protein
MDRMTFRQTRSSGSFNWRNSRSDHGGAHEGERGREVLQARDRIYRVTERSNSMQIFGVVVNRDDTVRVLSADVVKETPQFYIIQAPQSHDWRVRSDFTSAFGYSKRIGKASANTTARVALERYMARRQQHKASAQAVIAQATKQIASANELLMHLPELAQSVAAVDPVAGVSNG